MSKISHVLLVILGVAFVVGVVFPANASTLFADFEEGKWAFAKEIVIPEGIEEGTLVEIVPDKAVYSATSSNLRDIRIISGKGDEVAYVYQIARGRSQTESLPASVLNNGYVDGEYNTFEVDLTREGVLHNRIEILTTSENFKRDVVVESSADRDTWAGVAIYSIYDFTLRERGAKSQDTKISYPLNTSRYLRVRIMDDGEGALMVTGVRVLMSEDVAPDTYLWPAAITDRTENEVAQTTVITLDIGSEGLPSHRMTLDVSDVNFHRLVTLEQSNDGEVWRRIVSSAPIFSYDTAKFVGGSLGITYPEGNARYFRLHIHNRDNSPIQVEGASLEGFVRRVIFIADPAETYGLYYGNPEARQPSYDLNQIYPYLDTEGRVTATLGLQYMTEPEEEPVTPATEGLPWLLPTVIAGATVVVGLILYGILKQVKSLLPPPPE
ncbi:MAG: DUF3999 family protein [Chloroflexi bacterium]|nr:DUF3999 family protein [Chloroflexota bacterium]